MRFKAIGNSVYKDGVFYDTCLSCDEVVSGVRASMDNAKEKAKKLAEKLNNENKKYLTDEDFKLNDVDFLDKYKEVIESHGMIWNEEELLNKADWMVSNGCNNYLEHFEKDSETCVWCRLDTINYNRWVAGGGLERLAEEEKNNSVENNIKKNPIIDDIW